MGWFLAAYRSVNGFKMLFDSLFPFLFRNFCPVRCGNAGGKMRKVGMHGMYYFTVMKCAFINHF